MPADAIQILLTRGRDSLVPAGVLRIIVWSPLTPVLITGMA
jgi:hypothetical protein